MSEASGDGVEVVTGGRAPSRPSAFFTVASLYPRRLMAIRRMSSRSAVRSGPSAREAISCNCLKGIPPSTDRG